MKAKFVLLAVIVGALVAPIVVHIFYPSMQLVPYLKGGLAFALVIGSFTLLTSRNKKSVVNEPRMPTKGTAKTASPLSFVPKQDPIPEPVIDEPACIDGDLQSQSAAAEVAKIAPKTESVPAENSNVPAQASIPYLENPTVLELREVAARMDIYFIPFLRTISLEGSDVTETYKCVAVFDRSNTIQLAMQIPRVLLEEHISGDQGYVLRSSLLNWKDLPHELRNILLKAQEKSTSETITA